MIGRGPALPARTKIVYRRAGPEGSGGRACPPPAKYMGIGLRTLYTILDTGDLPSYKLGRVIRMKTVDVDAYLERCRVQPGSLSHLYPPGEDGDPPRKR